MQAAELVDVDVRVDIATRDAAQISLTTHRSTNEHGIKNKPFEVFLRS